MAGLASAVMPARTTGGPTSQAHDDRFAPFTANPFTAPDASRAAMRPYHPPAGGPRSQARDDAFAPFRGNLGAMLRAAPDRAMPGVLVAVIAAGLLLVWLARRTAA